MANYWSIKKTERKKAKRDDLWEKAIKKDGDLNPDFQNTRAFKRFKKVDRKITSDWVKKMTKNKK